MRVQRRILDRLGWAVKGDGNGRFRPVDDRAWAESHNGVDWVFGPVGGRTLAGALWVKATHRGRGTWGADTDPRSGMLRLRVVQNRRRWARQNHNIGITRLG